MLNSLQDSNCIFLFLIRMLYKSSLCFLAVDISLTFMRGISGTRSAEVVKQN